VAIQGLDKLQGKLRRLTRSVEQTRSEDRAIAFRVIDAINQRTLAGRDVNGNRFKPYSLQYSKYKRNRGGGWLSDTGKMLSSMTHKLIGSGKVMIFFRKRSENLKALGNQQIRPFFGLNDSDISKIVTRVRNRVRKALK